ncbi:MAG: hypothetical protein CVV33_00260 [Methanomicrobiales archaeon HGW-Methanomicrobiales-4]|nr:MAG: hypothetical protein CVV33_00260 [Methanomicrobiales archaeon HGW-Methanomicrobiales-4]
MVSVLLVDDEPALLDITITYLERCEDFCVHGVTSVQKAREFLSKQSYDVIISDYMMPETDGLAFLKELRRKGNTIPFIIFTGRGREEVAIEALNNGADFYLQKGGNSKTLYPELIEFIRKTGEEKKKQLVGISERTEIERSLTEHLNYVKALMDAIPAPVFYRDTQGVYHDCNRAFEELVGLKKEEIIGETIHDFFPQDLADHYQYMDELIIRSPHIQRYSYSIVNAQGEKYDVLFSKTALLRSDGSVRGIVGVIFDISERKRFERIVHESEEKYRTLAEYTYDWEAWFSPEGIYLYVSPSCERITGYGADEFLTQPDLVIRITHPDDRDMMQKHYEMMRTDKTSVHHMDYRIVTKSGEVRWISHYCQAVFRDDGTWVGRRESKREITIRKQMEQALQQVNLKLNLLSNITRHDVLNQLTALMGYTDIALEMSENPDLHLVLTQIMKAAETITEQISFTRIYQDIGLHEPVWQHVPSVIRRARTGIRFSTIEVMPSLQGLEVRADPLLEKVFFCLLENSERHGEQISIARFSCKKEDGLIMLIYEDDGGGIANWDKDRIFERGYGKNTGYGLFLAREILAISGVFIRETGIHGNGVRFEIGFPADNCRQTPNSGEDPCDIEHDS